MEECDYPGWPGMPPTPLGDPDTAYERRQRFTNPLTLGLGEKLVQVH